MATYAISFEIKYDTAAGWNLRYTSFMAEIDKCRKVWKETTSFCLVETTETLEAFERRLYLSKFDSTKDKMVVIDVSYDNCISRGAITDKATLKSLMPMIQHK